MAGGIKQQKLRSRIHFMNTTYALCRILFFWNHLLKYIKNSLEIQNPFAGNVGLRQEAKTFASLKNYE
jgi:hypothetical protein